MKPPHPTPSPTALLFLKTYFPGSSLRTNGGYWYHGSIKTLRGLRTGTEIHTRRSFPEFWFSIDCFFFFAGFCFIFLQFSWVWLTIWLYTWVSHAVRSIFTYPWELRYALDFSKVWLIQCLYIFTGQSCSQEYTSHLPVGVTTCTWI